MTKEKEFINSITLKTFIYFVFLVISVFGFNQNRCYAQEKFPSPGWFPNDPNGIKALKDYINQNLKYPEEAREAGISGTVLVSFLINEKGKVGNIKVLRGISSECDSEAVRITRHMPNWSPAKQLGVPVSAMVTMPIEFSLKIKMSVAIVSGRVTSKVTGLPLKNVKVILEGTTIGDVTGATGNYRIKVQEGGRNLQFILVGYAKKSEPIEENSTINVELDTEYYNINFNSQ